MFYFISMLSFSSLFSVTKLQGGSPRQLFVFHSFLQQRKLNLDSLFTFIILPFFPLISRQQNEHENHRTSYFNLDKIFSPKAFHFFSISHKDDSSPILFSSPILEIFHFSGTDLAGDMAYCTKNLPVEDDVALPPLCTSSPCPATSSPMNNQI